MNVNQKETCRLCFNTGNYFQAVNKTTTEILNVLLINVDINIIRNPVICQNCIAIAERSFHFKSICIETEKLLCSFAIGSKQTTFDLKDIFQHNKGEETLNEDSAICRFCMKRSRRSNFLAINTLMKEQLYVHMSEFIPELDLSIIMNPLICTTCTETIKYYLKFVKSCLDTEKEIKVYYKDRGRVFEKRMPLDIYEIELNITKGIGDLYCNDLMKIEHVVIKDETDILNKNLYEYRSEITHEYKHLCNTQILSNALSDINANPSEVSAYQVKQNIPYKDRNKGACQQKTNKDKITISQRGLEITYKCKSCTYTTKYKSRFRTHSTTHREEKTHKCALCKFESNRKQDYENHVVIHKNRAEVELFKCALCSFQTTLKCYLRKHMLRHKHAPDVTMYKCTLCSFVTKWKNSLQTHMLVHKDISESVLYTCKLCSYTTKYKSNFQTHLVTHRQEKIYKCALCTFENNRRQHYEDHMVTHKDPAEVEMLECALCGFQTTLKCYLRKHMLRHKNATDVAMYKCYLCNFETKTKDSLKAHMLTHRDISEVDAYVCSICSYKAKHKASLKRHMLVHMDASKMYNCSICSFRTKFKSGYKKHIRGHKDVSEIKTQ